MEETTMFLARLLGVYMLLISVIMLMRRKFFMRAVQDFIEDRALRFIIPTIELVAGIAVVLVHNIWQGTVETIVTLVGWLMVIESIFYLAMPEKLVKKALSAINKDGVYVACGIVCILLGLYLVMEGFKVSVTL